MGKVGSRVVKDIWDSDSMFDDQDERRKHVAWALTDGPFNFLYREPENQVGDQLAIRNIYLPYLP
jgi:hypothetical protein